MDYAIWFRKRGDKSGYDYFSHHVDDFLITAKNATAILKEIKESYTITGGIMPDHHLVMEMIK